MDNLSLAIFTSLKISGGYCNGLGFNYPAPLSFPPRGVAGMNRNGWPESIGISGRNAPEYAPMLHDPMPIHTEFPTLNDI